MLSNSLKFRQVARAISKENVLFTDTHRPSPHERCISSIPEGLPCTVGSGVLQNELSPSPNSHDEAVTTNMTVFRGEALGTDEG